MNASAGELAAVSVEASNLRIEGNIINGNDTATHFRHAMLGFGGSSNVVVDNNTFGGEATLLVYMNGQLNVNNPSNNLDFTNNTFSGTSGGALLTIDGGAGSSVTGNIFSGTAGAAVALQQPGILINGTNDFGVYGAGTDILTVDTTFSLAGLPEAENLAGEFAPPASPSRATPSTRDQRQQRAERGPAHLSGRH